MNERHSSRPPSRGPSEKVSMLSTIGFEIEVDEGSVTLQAGEPNLYQMYGSSKEDIFDSDQIFNHGPRHVDGDITINNAEKFLRLVVGDRKVLLEGEVDVMPASFRVELSVGDQYMTNIEQTKELVESLISGSSLQASQEAEADHDNFLSGVYIDEFIRLSEDVCRLSENLLDVYHPKPSVV